MCLFHASLAQFLYLQMKNANLISVSVFDRQICWLSALTKTTPTKRHTVETTRQFRREEKQTEREREKHLILPYQMDTEKKQIKKRCAHTQYKNVIGNDDRRGFLLHFDFSFIRAHIYWTSNLLSHSILMFSLCAVFFRKKKYYCHLSSVSNGAHCQPPTPSSWCIFSVHFSLSTESQMRCQNLVIFII